ncbi:flavin reductase family protein [Novosphingobium resinovorum]
MMISINRLQDGALKDTAANVLESREFVVHMADEAIAAQMHDCGTTLPPDQSELDLVGFTSIPSAGVKPPRIAEAPIAFECLLWETIETESRYIFLGKILHLHAREGLVDTDLWRVNLQDYFPVGRFGASFYTRTRDRFALQGEARKPPSTGSERRSFGAYEVSLCGPGLLRCARSDDGKWTWHPRLVIASVAKQFLVSAVSFPSSAFRHSPFLPSFLPAQRDGREMKVARPADVRGAHDRALN